MSKVKDVLSGKGSFVAAIAGTDTVSHAAEYMKEKRIGALVVTEGDSVVGIFTERDVLYRIVADGRSPSETRIQDVMTSPVACCSSETTINECRQVMTEKNIRHLPVVDENKLVGILSLRDLIDKEMEDQKHTIHYLNEYMYGA